MQKKDIMQNNDNEEQQAEHINESENISKSELPPVPQELESILNSLPAEQKATLMRQLSICISSTGIRREVPFEKIMTKEHLAKIIENADKDSQREYDDRILNKKYLFKTLIIALVFIIILVFGLVDKNPQILTGLLSYSATLIVGLCGGYGLRRCKDDE